MEQSVLPFRAVIELSDGSRVTRNFFAENMEQAKERAQHHARYERYVKFGESEGEAKVMLVAAVAGAPRNRHFKGTATKSTGGDETAAEGL